MLPTVSIHHVFYGLKFIHHHLQICWRKNWSQAPQLRTNFVLMLPFLSTHCSFVIGGLETVIFFDLVNIFRPTILSKSNHLNGTTEHQPKISRAFVAAAKMSTSTKKTNAPSITGSNNSNKKSTIDTKIYTISWSPHPQSNSRSWYTDTEI